MRCWFLKPNSNCGYSRHEIPTDRFSNHLSEEGPRKEIVAAVGWHQAY
jgi:hypothetical protein